MRTLTEAELAIEGERIGRALAPGAVVHLEGELGTGKTTMVRAIARGLGVAEAATSPTYALVHRYLGRRGPVKPREFNASSSTPFQDLKARFEWREGRLFAPVLEMNGPGLRVSGEGEVSAQPAGLDLRLQAALGRGASDLAALAGVTVPLQVRGPWRQPRFELDLGAASGPGLPRAPEHVPDTPVASIDVLAPVAATQRGLETLAGR